MIRTAFGQRLIAARRARGWNQYRLAEETRIPRQTLSAYERGLYLPGYDALEAISRALGVGPCALMGIPCRVEEVHAEALALQGRADALKADVEVLRRRLYGRGEPRSAPVGGEPPRTTASRFPTA